MNEILAHSPLFRGISTDTIQQLFTNLHYQIKKHATGDILIEAGEECNRLIIVLQGSVKGEMIDFNGKTIKIEDIAAPRPLAIGFLFGNNNRFPVTITANEATQIVVIQKAEVLKLMQNNAIFLTNFLDAVSGRAQFLSKKLSFLSFKTIRGKLAQYLLELSEKSGQLSIPMLQSQQELADLFGVTRPSLTRTLNEMSKEKILFHTRYEIRIVNKDNLKRCLE